MKRYVLLLPVMFGVVAGCHAASPSFSSFYTNHFTTNNLVIKANLNPTQFDTNSSSITITITNVSGIAGGSLWTNISGVIQPRSGQTTNALSFTSGSSDNATNTVLTIDTVETWTDQNTKLLQLRHAGTNVAYVTPYGSFESGKGVSWASPSQDDLFLGVHDFSLGESDYALIYGAAIDGSSPTNYAEFSAQMNSGASPAGTLNLAALTNGVSSYFQVTVQPDQSVARIELQSQGQRTFYVEDQTGYSGAGTKMLGDDGKYHDGLVLWTNISNVLQPLVGFDVLVTNLTSVDSLVANGSFHLNGVVSSNLIANTNNLNPFQVGTFQLVGPSTTASDSRITLSTGIGYQFLVIQNSDTNSAFNMRNGEPQWDDPSSVIHLSGGDWNTTNKGDGMLLYHNGLFWSEIGRFFANTNTSTPVVMNPTDTYLPYRQSAGVFADSLLQYRDTNYMTLHGFGAGLFIGSHAEAWYGSGLTGEALVAANIVADGDPDDAEMLIASVDGSNSGEFHVTGSSLGMNVNLSVNGTSPSQLSLTTKGIHQRLDSGDFHISLDPFGLVAAAAPFYFNQDAVYDGTNVLAQIDYQTNTQFRVNIDSGYTGAGTLFLADDGNYKAAGTTINPSDNYLPVRTSSTAFGDSPLHVPSAGSSNLVANGGMIFGGQNSLDYFGGFAEGFAWGLFNDTDNGGNGAWNAIIGGGSGAGDQAYLDIGGSATSSQVSATVFQGSDNYYASFNAQFPVSQSGVYVGWETTNLVSLRPFITDGADPYAHTFDTANPLSTSGIATFMNGKTNMLSVGPAGQIIFGPGTTNVLSRSANDLLYTNGGAGVFFKVIDGSGVSNSFGINSGGQGVITVSSGTMNMTGNSIVITKNIRPNEDNLYDIGADNSSGAYNEAWLKGSYYAQGANDGAGNYTRGAIRHTGNAGEMRYVSEAGGTQTFRPHLFMVGSTNVAKFDTTSSAGETRFWLYDEDNGTMERVTVGVPDSGGAGFKLLRIPN